MPNLKTIILELPDPAKTFLVRTLAAQQVIWRPVRQDWHAFGAIWVWRHSKALRVARARSADRESTSVWRARLIGRGVIQADGRLTAEAKRIVRSWVWEFSPRELRTAARRLLAAIDRRDVLDLENEPLEFVSEQLITNEFWGTQNALLAHCFLPWLCDGILLSRTDVGARVLYAVADRSMNLVRMADRLVDSGVDFDSELVEIYCNEADRVRSAMLSDKDTHGEIGEGPLGLRGLKSGRNDLQEDLKLKPIFEISNA